MTAKVFIDSGCQGNYVSPAFLRKAKIPQKKKQNPYGLYTFDNQPMLANKGRIDKETGPIPVTVGTHQEMLNLDVTETSTYDATFGLPWLEKHDPRISYRKGVIKFENCECQPTTEIQEISLKAMAAFYKRDPNSVVLAMVSLEKGPDEFEPPLKEYRRFKPLFQEELGKEALPKHQPWDHEIPLIEGKQPKAQPIYSLSRTELEALREYINKNKAKGYIRESTSPARYPILFVPKPDGKLRLCVDYRRLNEITVKNRYTLPLIHEMQDRIKGAKWFTKLDLRDGYYRIRIKEGDEWKTAFGSRLGHYEYLVMPFGLTNAPASYQSLINNILRKYLDDFVVAYLDDILIYSKTKEEHIKHVTAVLEALEKADVRINGAKSVFHVQRVNFLGYVLTTDGVEMDPVKTAAIRDWPTPKNVTEVQEFMGFANFYRKFIRGYSGVSAPLTDLTKKDKTFAWTENEETAFKELKRRFSEAPILAIFDPEEHIVLETDASDYAIGACISQLGKDRKLHPIAFHSRKMIPAETNYDIHDKELLAVVTALQEWRVYLEGSKYPVKVLTDHKNLTWFTTTKVLNRRQVRWAEILASYNFQIHYQKGSENGRADALSRRADHREDSKEKTPWSILKQNDDGSLEYNHRITASSLTITYEDGEKAIKEAYKEDTWAQHVLKEPPRDTKITIKEGVILMDGLIYVPQSLRREVFAQHHDTKVMGHQGIDRTLERIQRIYYFPKMRNYVEEQIRKCSDCQRNKSSRHKPYGKLQPNQAPTGAWEDIAMDFIVKLPVSKEPGTNQPYDSIFVATDRLTKYGYFIPCREDMSAEDLAYLFNRHVVSQHGVPKRIISDRDKLYRRFWMSLMNQLGIHHKLSTAYHPETDGATERLNQTLEQYLRHFVNYQQDNWVELLPTAQLAYNATATSTTGVSPFYANYGFNPKASWEARDMEHLVEVAMVQADKLKDLHRELSRDIEWINQRMTLYANKSRLEGPHLRGGDLVYLLRRNIKTTRPSDKLDSKKIGPFKVKRNIRDISFELELPPTMRIHPVFHISLLEPAHPDTPEGPAPELDPEIQELVYDVESILAVRRRRNRLQWLVKWEGYAHEENTWEPKEMLTNCPVALQRFYQENPGAPGQEKRKTEAKGSLGPLMK